MDRHWRIYYKGGPVISSDDYTPDQVPGLVEGHGVLAVSQWDQEVDKREATHGTGVYVVNWYWWDAEAQWWIGGDDVGLALYLGSPGWKKVLPAETAPNEEWRRVAKQAIYDYLEDGQENDVEVPL